VSFPALVGSKEYADVVFHIGNHALYAHRCVVEARCPPLFAVAIKDRGKKGLLATLKSDEKLVDIRSLTLVLEYLYTGSVPFAEVTPAEVISLIAHAELYQIDRLRWLCERYLQAVLSNELFFTLLLLSDVSGVASAKQLCLTYGSVHFEELIVKKEQVHTLGIELFREFVVFSTLNTEVTPDLNQVSFPNTIKEEFKIIFTAMANPDAFFTFKSANTTVPCHKAILYAQSERFKTLFLEDGPSASENRYSLPKNIAMSHEAFKSFLAWAYYRDTSFSAAHAAMILPLAHDFNIATLVDECSSKLRKGISIDSVLPILNLCFSEWGKQGGYSDELSKPCLSFLMCNFAHVDLTGLKSAAICAAIAKSIRESVTSGLWTPITPFAVAPSSLSLPINNPAETSSSAPSDQPAAAAAATEEISPALASPTTQGGDESSAAESSGLSTTLSSTSLAVASANNASEGGDDKRSARRKKRRTLAVDATELATAIAGDATSTTAETTPTSPKETVDTSNKEQPAPTASAAPKSPKVRKAEENVEEKASSPTDTKPAVAAQEKDATPVNANGSSPDEEAQQQKPAGEDKEADTKKEEVEAVAPSEVAATPVVTDAATTITTTTATSTTTTTTSATTATTSASPVKASSEEKKKEDKEPSAVEKKDDKEPSAVEKKEDKPVQANGASAKPPKADPANKTSKSHAKVASSSSSSSLPSSDKPSIDKPAVADKPEKADKSSSDKSSKKDKSSTQERRANLEPSTSVKAIKETFEAKGREDLVEKEAHEKLRAGRRTGDKHTSSSSSKKDKSK